MSAEIAGMSAARRPLIRQPTKTTLLAAVNEVMSAEIAAGN
jgi:hypothetical protein